MGEVVYLRGAPPDLDPAGRPRVGCWRVWLVQLRLPTGTVEYRIAANTRMGALQSAQCRARADLGLNVATILYSRALVRPATTEEDGA